MKKISIFFFILISFNFNACQVAEQVTQMSTFAKCQFRIASVQNITLAGVDVQKIQQMNQISALDVFNITTAFASGSLPLSMMLNIEVKNPNASTAAMNALEWIFLIDQTELLRGNLTQQIKVNPNGGVTNLPLQISVDLKKAINGQSMNSLVNLALNLVDASNKPCRVSLKIKPSIMFGNYSINYPGYITIQKEFSAQ